MLIQTNLLFLFCSSHPPTVPLGMDWRRHAFITHSQGVWFSNSPSLLFFLSHTLFHYSKSSLPMTDFNERRWGNLSNLWMCCFTAPQSIVSQEEHGGCINTRWHPIKKSLILLLSITSPVVAAAADTFLTDVEMSRYGILYDCGLNDFLQNASKAPYCRLRIILVGPTAVRCCYIFNDAWVIAWIYFCKHIRNNDAAHE